MGKLDDFSIHINNTNGMCYAGDTLQGYIAVDLNRPMKMTGISLRVKGEANVSFDLKSDGEIATVQGSEIYFEENMHLFSTASSKPEITVLKEGPHSFDFQFCIPDSSPPSFEGEFGWVRYSLECRIEKPWKSDYVLEDYFQVMNRLDLNLKEEAKEPFHKEMSRTDACCFCYDNGDVTVCLDLPRRGFVPGESIPVTAEIKNHTPGFVSTSVHFIKKVTYNSPETDRTKVSKDIVNQIPDFELEPRSKYVINREKIEVPSVPPSCLPGCNLITVSYFLKVKACTEYSGVHCKVVADLIIGTEPLASLSGRSSHSALQDEAPAPLACPESENQQ